jgi:hypothetical protein
VKDAVDGLAEVVAEAVAEVEGDGARLVAAGGLTVVEVGIDVGAAVEEGAGVAVEAQPARISKLTTTSTAKNSFLKLIEFIPMLHLPDYNMLAYY